MMMSEMRCLNYTHGNMLQGFCCDLLLQLKDQGDLDHYRQWLQYEKRNMCKNQSAAWGPTASQVCYLEYLEELMTLMEGTPAISEIERLAQEIKAITREKIHILFLTQETSCWPSIESVFYAAQKSEDYEPALVYTPFYHKNYKEQTDYFAEYQQMGVPVLRHSEYDLPKDSPDVVYMIKPYGNTPDEFQFHELEKVVPRAIYVPYGMEITLDLVKYGFQHYLQYKAWRHSVYGPIVKDYAEKYGFRNGENIAVWGHPKADHYRDQEKANKNIPDEWKEKIGDRKVILWTPHHLIRLDGDGTGTWLVWGEKILHMALQTPEVVFIFRPHPLLMGALENDGGMSSSRVEKLEEKIRGAANIIWDESPVYHNAFDAADAIITDGTTFSIEFLYTKKPIMLTPRNMQGFYLYEEMLESYYIAHSADDVGDFIAMIRDGEDPLREKRIELHDKTFFVPQKGTVGENILENVKKDLTEECRKPDLRFILSKVEFRGPTMRELKSTEMIDQELPLVSVLVFCYKNTELLYGMLDTIFKQDYPRIQLIVSDDCSEDFDVDAVKNYVENKMRRNIESVLVRKNEVNMRTVRHIHDVVEMAEGDYVIFTAADDRFVGTDALSSYVAEFAAKPEAQWLVARCQFTSADYKTNKYVSPVDKDEPYFLANDPLKLFSRWSRRGMAIPCCMAFRKTAFELVGGIDLEYTFIEDWPLVIKLLRNGYAPIYLRKITAIHSMGGISNSNDRYGREIRRMFYDDKYLFFRKEVEPYKHLLTKEDKKCYKQYMREIMARHYFFFIDWPEKSGKEKLRLLIQKPVRAWWVFEQQFVKNQAKIPKKKMIIAAHALLLISQLLLHLETQTRVNWIFQTVGIIDLLAAICMGGAAVIAYLLGKYFAYKQKLRNMLVN